jgi:hypothetical protein
MLRQYCDRPDQYFSPFCVFQILLASENYVTKRRSLKLLAEILLDRSNYTVMMRYISSKHNLKVRFVAAAICQIRGHSHGLSRFLLNVLIFQTIMNLLRNKSTQIQFE